MSEASLEYELELPEKIENIEKRLDIIEKKLKEMKRVE